MVAWGCAVDNVGQCTVPGEATSGVSAIAAGGFHSLALKGGGVIAWGCGIDTGACSVPGAATSGVTAIAAGPYHSLALKQDGSVVAWGCRDGNDYGQCNVPAAASSGVKAIAAGGSHSLALKKDGSVVAWGCGGIGNWQQCTVPASAANAVTAVAAGANHSLALSDPLDQTITVTTHAPASAIFKESFTVAATASSGLPVAYSSAGACSNSGPTFTMTSGTGTCEVKYDQPGGGAYNEAPQVVEPVAAQPIPCTVPNVVGKRLPRAKREIAQSHCRTGKIRRAFSRRSKGIVISQSRRPGRVVPARSKIGLVVSRGRKR